MILMNSRRKCGLGCNDEGMINFIQVKDVEANAERVERNFRKDPKTDKQILVRLGKFGLRLKLQQTMKKRNLPV
jgi:hypothetical protein